MMFHYNRIEWVLANTLTISFTQPIFLTCDTAKLRTWMWSRTYLQAPDRIAAGKTTVLLSAVPGLRFRSDFFFSEPRGDVRGEIHVSVRSKTILTKGLT